MMVDLEGVKLIDHKVKRLELDSFRIHMVVEKDRDVGHKVIVHRETVELARVDHIWERIRYSVRTERLIEGVVSIAAVG